MHSLLPKYSSYDLPSETMVNNFLNDLRVYHPTGGEVHKYNEAINRLSEALRVMIKPIWPIDQNNNWIKYAYWYTKEQWFDKLGVK